MVIEHENSYVSLKYTVRLENGDPVKGDPGRGLAHMEFITGYNQVLPGLEKRLIGLSPGTEAEFTIGPEEAFGPHDPALVQERNFAEFAEGRHLEEGRWVRATNPQHLVSYGYKVVKKRPDSVVLDYNHPLAGESLIYQVWVEKVREATPEELEILKPCVYADPDHEP